MADIKTNTNGYMGNMYNIRGNQSTKTNRRWRWATFELES